MQSQQRRNQVRNAYTLIEVLVVVTILGIAGAVVAPSLGQAGALRIQAAVRMIVSDITFAQMDALGYQEQRAIVFDVDNNGYTLIQVNGTSIDVDADALYDPKGPGQRYRISLNNEIYGGTVIESADFDGNTTLIYDEMGGPVSAPGTSTLSDGGSIVLAGPLSRFRIDIAAFTGRVTVTRLD
ncbi:MAG: type II secretion system protein [Phycisphaerales bacterium]|nr:type II secretion system protein [Phycisphaerales bacterium]